MHRARTLRKLVFNACRYRLLKYSGRPGPLESISLEITHHCICRCQMCNIWQIPHQVSDLPLSDWTELLSYPELRGLRELDITGGEPFLRKDLGDLLQWICRSKSDRFPKLKTLAITTNGILTNRIIEVTAGIVGPLQDQGIDLVLACGMDAIGELHDHIRNYTGAWQKLEATLAGLKRLRKGHSNLILGIKTTIVPANVRALERIAAFAEEHGLFTIISPCIITANRFGNLTLKKDLGFSAADLLDMIRFYEGPAFTWSSHRQSMLHYLRTNKMKKPCSAGFNTFFVRHNGEVFPCPVIPTALGNFKSVDLGTLLSEATATKFRQQIGSFPECEICTEPGLERISWPFEGFTCLCSLVKMGGKNFDSFATHMGFDKYL